MKMDNEKKKSDLHIRLTKDQKERLVALARGAGFNSYSDYVRFILFNPTFDLKLNRILEIVKEVKEKVNEIEIKKC